MKPKIDGLNDSVNFLGFKSGYAINNIIGKDYPKNAPSTSETFFLGKYTYLQRGQYIFTLDVFNVFDKPIGITFCCSQ